MTPRSKLVLVLTALLAVLPLAASVAATAQAPLYRVNAGGPEVSGNPVWELDNAKNPSPWLVAGGENAARFDPPALGPTLPAGTPAQIFEKERWDPEGGADMTYSFPVAPGQYEVRLYFAESYPPAQVIGGRVFDIFIEGELALDDFDIYRDFGAATAGMVAFLVQADSSIDIVFGREVQNPNLNGIEILPAGSQADQLGVSPTELTITAESGVAASSAVTLTNLGSPGDPDIDVLDATTTGAGFSDDFAGPLTLGPGASTQIQVTYAAGAPGTDFGNLSIDHSGVNTPVDVALTGNSLDPGLPTLDATPVALSFSAPPGGSETLSLTLTHAGDPGDADLTVFDASPSNGTFVSDFVGPVVLAPGAQTSFDVTFQPTSSGNYSATLSITHDGGNSPLGVPLQGTSSAPGQISFDRHVLSGTSLANPTTLQFGPDGRLYVGQQNGRVQVYTVQELPGGGYDVVASETIDLLKNIPNHDDDGSPNPGVTSRQLTGILVTGTPSNPVIYAGTSDPRIGGGTSGEETGLDTNSGVLSRLTWTGSGWSKLDLVRGLPRSEENHSINGLHMNADGTILYAAVGGNTNQGARSNNFALLPEYALSAAILSIDLVAIGETTYDLPTLDDEDQPGPDATDPFGGNDGKNQARLVNGGPVQIYAPGLRNPYDIEITEAGIMWTIDNGPNAGWGDVPVGEGPGGTCTNAINEPGKTFDDGLILITGPGHYGGHPNPTRANRANTFNLSNPQSPIDPGLENPVECDYRKPVAENGAFTSFASSTNGLAEYTASNFGGALKGDLLAATFGNKLKRIDLNATGDGLDGVGNLFGTVGVLPLDVVAQGDTDPFPGSIWVTDFLGDAIIAYTPADGGGVCTGAYDPGLDEDGDGFDNADEIDNGVDPCSPGDTPPDVDGDFTSNLNDPDDDNDGLSDSSDRFAVDPDNGLTTPFPFFYGWDNDQADLGGLLGLGFTGLMTNGVSDYESLYDPEKMTAGGAAGVVTVDEAPEGDALDGNNDQAYGFQLGFAVDPASPTLVARTRLGAPFAGVTPEGLQSAGLYIGTGTQDDFLRLVIAAGGGSPQIELTSEVGGVSVLEAAVPIALANLDVLDLTIEFDPSTGQATARFRPTYAGVPGSDTDLGAVVDLPPGWFDGSQALAVGIISTSRGPAPPFAATWDFLEVDCASAGACAPPTPALDVSPASVALGDVQVGGSSTQATVVLENLGGLGSADIVVSSVTVGAPFSTDFAGPVVLPPGGGTSFHVVFQPTVQGPASDSIEIVHDGLGGLATVAVSGNGVSAPSGGTPLFRVNAGGPEVPDDPAWEIDNLKNPSPYLVSGGEKATRYDPPALDPSIPPGTPAQIFEKERWDPPGGDDMAYSFPVTPGDYEVRLYFAEGWPDAQVVGGRTFDVFVEGVRVLDDFDVFATFGASIGGMVAFQITADADIDILFGREVQNPMVNAIEIVAAGGGPSGSIVASPPSLDFGSVLVGQASTPAGVTLTHTGGPGDPDIEVTSVTDVGDFSTDFAGPVLLSPGDSTSFDVTFAPSQPGAALENLEVAVSGGSPLSIPCFGIGTGGTLALSPDSIAFGSLPVGVSSAPETVTVQNTGDPGDPDVTLTGVTVGAGFSTDFSGPVVLPPGGQTTFDVVFTPPSAGSFASNLTVESDASSSGDPVVLSGSGAAPGQSGLEVSPTRVDFGALQQGLASAPVTLTVTNVGQAGDPSIEVQGLSAGAGFVLGFGGPVTLAPGDSTTATVTFAPGAVGVFDSVVSIANDDGASLEVPVQGVGSGAVAAGNVSAVLRINNESTYTSESFRMRNDSPSGQRIVRARIDLRTAMVDDPVFDPDDGTYAGDPVGKDFTVDRDDGVGLVGHLLSSPHDDGYDVLEIEFADFDPGEVFTFSIDIDPTSIRGSAQPGPAQSGSVSGLELIGTTVEYEFEGGDVVQGQTFRVDDVDANPTSSKVTLEPSKPAAPFLELVGQPVTPVKVTDTAQTIRVHGVPGTTVVLVQLDAGLFVDEPGFDIDAFEVNKSEDQEETTVVIPPAGFADVPVTLLRSRPESGANLFVAATLSSSNGDVTSLMSNRLVVDLRPLP